MKEITCRCGASKKRFKYDIGEFFVNDCCLKDYDELGKPKNLADQAKADPALQEALAYAEKGPSKELVESVQREVKKAGRGKLMDMKIDDLKALAKEKGIEGADGMTKKQLVAAILQ